MATNAPNISALFTGLKQTTESMNTTVSRLEKMVTEAQPQLALVMANAAKTSEAVQRASVSIDQTVATNKVIVGQTLTNVQQLTGRLDKTAADIQKTVSTNRENIQEIVANVKDVSENLKEATGNISKVVALFEKGKGLVEFFGFEAGIEDFLAAVVGQGGEGVVRGKGGKAPFSLGKRQVGTTGGQGLGGVCVHATGV